MAGGVNCILTVLPSVVVNVFANGGPGLRLRSGLLPLSTVFKNVFIEGPLLGLLLMKFKNTGLLGGTNRTTLKVTGGATIRGPACGGCRRRDLGPEVSRPTVGKGDVVTSISKGPYIVNVSRATVSTCRGNFLPLSALTGTILEGCSRGSTLTTKRCRENVNRRRRLSRSGKVG